MRAVVVERAVAVADAGQGQAAVPGRDGLDPTVGQLVGLGHLVPASCGSSAWCASSPSESVHRPDRPAVGDAGEVGHVPVEGGEVGRGELVRGGEWPQARASTCMSSTDARRNRSSRCGGLVDGQPGPQVRLLGGDADRAVVGVAGPHAEAADGLDGRVGHRHGVGAERQGLGEVGGVAQPAGDDQGDVAAARAGRGGPGPGQRRDGRAPRCGRGRPAGRRRCRRRGRRGSRSRRRPRARRRGRPRCAGPTA